MFKGYRPRLPVICFRCVDGFSGSCDLCVGQHLREILGKISTYFKE